MNTEGKKILISGGAGFVGSQLGYHLSKQNHEIILLDNMSYGHLDNLIIDGRTFGSLIVKDIRESGLSSIMKGVDTVFHFAGIAPLPVCQTNPELAWEVNSAAVANILEAARLADVRRVIFSSTSAVYENSHAESYSESIEVAPDLCYAMTKHSAEKICNSYARNYGMDIIVARFFNLFGPHQDFKRLSPPFTSYIARELSLNRSPTLFNKSDAKRDYVFIYDVIDLLCRMMRSSKTYSAEIFNIGSGKSYSVPEIYEKMLKISGKNIEATYGDPQGYWDAYPGLFASTHPLNRERIVKEVFKSALADITKSSLEFDWKPEVGIDEGLKAVYEYAKQHS